jgi:hypothetical protein
MRCTLPFTALALVVVLSPGCDPAPSDTGCTLDARTSLVLSVVDAETGEEVDAMVTLRIDGEASSEVDEGGPGRYLLGLERDGTFEVTVSAAGYEPATREYEVTADECHVMTVEATLELVPSP